jgi:hypothetical protein
MPTFSVTLTDEQLGMIGSGLYNLAIQTAILDGARAARPIAVGDRVRKADLKDDAVYVVAAIVGDRVAMYQPSVVWDSRKKRPPLGEWVRLWDLRPVDHD